MSLPDLGALLGDARRLMEDDAREFGFAGILTEGLGDAATAAGRALQAEEQATVLAVLHEPRFVDLAPAEVYATLLDEGQHLCSERTMYRLLAQHHEVHERRNQLRHPRYAAPELLARRPSELWSRDITKLLGPVKRTYFYLYVMLDVFWNPCNTQPFSLASEGALA